MVREGAVPDPADWKDPLLLRGSQARGLGGMGHGGRDMGDRFSLGERRQWRMLTWNAQVSVRGGAGSNLQRPLCQ